MIVILLAFMPQFKLWNDYIIEYGVILELVSIGEVGMKVGRGGA